MNKFFTSFMLCAACCIASTTNAQEVAGDSVMQHVKGNRLSIGGYGEVVMARNFYSDNVYRYSRPQQYKDDPSHGRFDIPHAVIYLGYDFGKGWTLGTEIEFEHGGTGVAMRKVETLSSAKPKLVLLILLGNMWKSSRT